MKALKILALAGLAGVSLTIGVRAAGDLVAFPETYAKGVLYTTVDRADNKQFRELYAPQDVIDAVKAGKSIPSGAVLTMVIYKALLTAAGEPQKSADGRFIKGPFVSTFVMEKRAGWGAEYPDEMRNGEWEYQAFKADKSVNEAANLKACFTCHKPLDKQDFVSSIEKIKAAN